MWKAGPDRAGYFGAGKCMTEQGREGRVYMAGLDRHNSVSNNNVWHTADAWVADEWLTVT